MKLFGITGHSGMGKTTLLERLIPELRQRGVSVSLVKHSHKPIDIDRPGKDSHRLRLAGCSEVLLMGEGRWALMHEQRDEPEPRLEFLIARLAPCDLVLVEGFGSGVFPKLEVWREAEGQPLLAPGKPGVIAVASDTPERVPGELPKLDLAAVGAIADLVLAQARPWSSVQP